MLRIQNNNVNFTPFLGERSVGSIFLGAVTEKEVEIEVGNLNGNKSCGHDEIPPKLVKEVSNQIVKPLTHIYDQSLPTGVIPNKLKIHLLHLAGPLLFLIYMNDISRTEILSIH